MRVIKNILFLSMICLSFQKFSEVSLPVVKENQKVDSLLNKLLGFKIEGIKVIKPSKPFILFLNVDDDTLDAYIIVTDPNNINAYNWTFHDDLRLFDYKGIRVLVQGSDKYHFFYKTKTTIRLRIFNGSPSEKDLPKEVRYSSVKPLWLYKYVEGRFVSRVISRR